MIPPRDALDRLWHECTAADWTGWDPYDGLMVRRWPATLLRRTRPTRLALIQTLKLLPVNLRPLLAVPRLRNAKALALGLSAAVRLARFEDLSVRAAVEARRLVAELARAAVPTASGAGWGYPFDWQSRSFFCPAGVPTVVCTGFVARALDEAAQAGFDQDGVVPGLVEGAARFVLGDLQRSTDGDGFCFSYSPLDSTRVVNATLLGAETVARHARLSGRPDLLEEIRPTIGWSLAHQREDGGWAYGRESHLAWEDGFHTGFNLLSLRAISAAAERSGMTPDTLVPADACRLGYAHYKRSFIGPDGRARYYRQSPWPEDPHAAAVAILTLLAFRDEDPDAAATADKVVSWALGRFLRADGRLIFRRYERYSIRIPFLRWSAAWMLLALAERHSPFPAAP